MADLTLPLPLQLHVPCTDPGSWTVDGWHAALLLHCSCILIQLKTLPLRVRIFIVASRLTNHMVMCIPGGDLDYEGTTGERPKKLLVEKLMSGYLEALIKLAADDITVFKAIQEVRDSRLLSHNDKSLTVLL